MGMLDPSNEPPPAYSQLGHALELSLSRMFEHRFPGRFYDIGELERDGIYLTPDLIDSMPDHGRPDLGRHEPNEIKLTWMGSSHPPDSAKWWRYRAQLMGYCWVLRSLSGVLRVVYVNEGTWKPVRFIWTHNELREHWAMLKSVARVLARERGIEFPPPKPTTLP